MPTPPHVLALREKIGHDRIQLPGITAIVVNARGEVLLQKRSDFGYWHTIGGCVDPGETPAACAVREVREETGVDCRVVRLTGVYALPDVVYPNGDRVSFVTTTFLCRTAQPDPVPRVTDDESLEVRFFPPDALPELKPDALGRLRDALAGRAEAVFER